MMDKVLERLQSLQLELAAIDPSHELDLADKVASIASAFRDALAGAQEASGRLARPHADLHRAG